ncbi:uncharacterized protein LOC121404940 [Drosophila obscura]|uniref:uncharacterized protein LOC121404939 n=1 Tax=Drosophila obscura TaxID=7282 RepID=UPI001BB16F6E|nr:uncharacterized protein LOC121404939 [Drosophila obscura]XP_041451292.1 uncharacterized protein LOC121404940 [Drosophila obscura]
MDGFRSNNITQNAVILIENELASLKSQSPEKLPISPDAPEECETSINDLLFSFLKAKHAAKAGSKRVDSIKALKTYMEQSHLNQDPLEFWKNCTDETVGLQQIARHCLFIPATSTASEPMFSKAADIVSAKRTLLKTSNVDKLLFLNKNIDI